MNIDEGLVTENLATKEDIVSMDNGCVCCTVRGDLVRTLNSLIVRRKDFHAIMLETTGLADPAPIIQTFNSDATLQVLEPGRRRRRHRRHRRRRRYETTD